MRVDRNRTDPMHSIGRSVVALFVSASQASETHDWLGGQSGFNGLSGRLYVKGGCDAICGLTLWNSKLEFVGPFLPNTSPSIRSMSKRSRILVDPQVQWSIAGRIICHWVLFLIILVTISAMVRIVSAVGDQPLSEAWRTAATAQIPILVVMILLLPLFVRDTMKLSNRFAGPMYRLRTVLKALADKQPANPIKFRNGDFWHEAATDFNVVLEDYQSLKQENAELKAKLAEMPEPVEV